MTTIQFSADAIGSCSAIVSKYFDLANEAMRLKGILIRDKVITDETSFYQFKDNIDLMTALLLNLSLGLSKSVEQSRYGCQVVSDFDLYHNMSTDQSFSAKLSLSGASFTAEKYLELKRKRNSLRSFLHRLRASVIDLMDLIDTPSREELRAEKAVKRKTEQDIEEEIQNRLQKAKIARIEKEHVVQQGLETPSSTADLTNNVRKHERWYCRS
jgi:hypothetical protein